MYRSLTNQNGDRTIVNNNTLFDFRSKIADALSKTRYYCTLITSAVKVRRHLPYTVNYQVPFGQSRTRIKFEYIMISNSDDNLELILQGDCICCRNCKISITDFNNPPPPPPSRTIFSKSFEKTYHRFYNIVFWGSREQMPSLKIFCT